MKYRVTFMAGAAVGYVLGTRAGRERYEQIRRASQRLVESPAVQDAAGRLRSRGGDLAGVAKDKAGEFAVIAWHRMPGQREESTPREYQDPRRETVP